MPVKAIALLIGVSEDSPVLSKGTMKDKIIQERSPVHACSMVRLKLTRGLGTEDVSPRHSGDQHPLSNPTFEEGSDGQVETEAGK